LNVGHTNQRLTVTESNVLQILEVLQKQQKQFGKHSEGIKKGYLYDDVASLNLNREILV